MLFSQIQNERSAPQLDYWKVLYNGRFETGIKLDATYLFNNDTLNNGDSLKLAIKVKKLFKFSN